MNVKAFGKTTMALFFFLIMTVALIPELKAFNIGNCNTCDKVYRYHNNTCPEKASDCGTCIRGLEEREDKTCHYVWNVSHNSNAIIKIGDTVILSCYFEVYVGCIWFKETLVEIDDRIRYVNGNGDKARDCSIQIKNFKNADVGKWTCSSMGTSSSVGILKSNVSLEIANTTNESESLVPEIRAKEQHEFEGMMKSKRSSADQKATNLWFECRVKSIPPAKLYWTLNDKNQTAIANTVTNRETVSFFSMSTLSQDDKEIHGSILKCRAEYPNINITFTTAVTITLGSSYDLQNEQMPSTHLTIILGVLCCFLFVAVCSIGIILYVFMRKKNARSSGYMQASENAHQRYS